LDPDCDVSSSATVFVLLLRILHVSGDIHSGSGKEWL